MLLAVAELDVNNNIAVVELLAFMTPPVVAIFILNFKFKEATRHFNRNIFCFIILNKNNHPSYVIIHIYSFTHWALTETFYKPS